MRYKPPNEGHQSLTLLAGVILPAIAITLEATAHICAQRLFEPIPSVWHLILVIFVPVAQLHIWFIINRGTTQRLVLASWLNVLSLGVSIFYSIVFIPLLPLAVLPIVGIFGLLPLAPVLSVVAGIVQRRQLKHIAAPQKLFMMRKAGLVTGLVLTAVFIGLLELPASITHYGLKLAASSSPETRAKGIHFLRIFGSKKYLLRACYGREARTTDFINYFFTLRDPVTPKTAEEIYYRVTGEPCVAFPPQSTEGLSLANSRLYTDADANGGIAYTEWTLVFSNESAPPGNARAEIQLPPGAVVSRVTRWVNGVEREAVFAGKDKATEASQQVRIDDDPVLVTMSGPDRILVECFPAPADNGKMKLRIGITTPLLLEDLNNARLLFPHFLDTNFRIPDNVKHFVWIESQSSIISASSAFSTTEFTPGTYAHQDRISEEEMSKPETSILIGRTNTPIWSKDPFQNGNFIIQQTFEARVPSHLYRIVLVVDTSAATGDVKYALIDALRSIPFGFDFKLVLADASGLSHYVIASDAKEASEFLSNATFEGGADNVPALLKAWDLATEKPGNNAIVWVHGPQASQLDSTEELKRRWDSGPYGPALYSVQTTSGSDEILKTLDKVKTVPRTNQLDVALRKLFQRLTSQMTALEWVRTSKKIESLPKSDEGIETSDQLARLWANDEVARILAAKDESLNEAATMLAARYQILTPVTDAVVSLHK